MRNCKGPVLIPGIAQVIVPELVVEALEFSFRVQLFREGNESGGLVRADGLIKGNPFLDLRMVVQLLDLGTEPIPVALLQVLTALALDPVLEPGAQMGKMTVGLGVLEKLLRFPTESSLVRGRGQVPGKRGGDPAVVDRLLTDQLPDLATGSVEVLSAVAVKVEGQGQPDEVTGLRRGLGQGSPELCSASPRRLGSISLIQRT